MQTYNKYETIQSLDVKINKIRFRSIHIINARSSIQQVPGEHESTSFGPI